MVKLALSKPPQSTQFEVEAAETLSEAIRRLGQGSYNAVLLDLGLPDSNGIDTVRKAHEANPDTAIIVLTGLDDEQTGIEAIKAGAEDYMVKGESLQYFLMRVIQYAIERKQIKNNLIQSNRQLELMIKRTNLLAEEAIKSSKSKSHFLANMSHDIRTPMNAIIGFSDLLGQEELTAEQREYVKAIHGSGNSLLSLINDILDFSKIESGKLDIDIVEFDLKDLLANVQSLMRQLANEKELDFQINQSEQLPGLIYSDPDRLQQCLVNLINNAIKFTSEGHVYVNVSAEPKDQQPYIRFDVEDSGIGIAAEEQAVIFDSFSQADGSTYRKYGGTGLGLAITKQLVRLLGGQIELSSEQGKGSTFSFVIPAGLALAKTAVPDEQRGMPRTKVDKEELERCEFSGRVLVAEDVESNQALIKSLLHKLGLDVSVVSDGSEAVQTALGQDFELILMDMQMPNMNGYEATKLLRSKGVATPIIALTANAIKGDDRKCIEAGCDDYLGKPFERTELLEKLHKYLPACSREESISDTNAVFSKT